MLVLRRCLCRGALQALEDLPRAKSSARSESAWEVRRRKEIDGGHRTSFDTSVSEVFPKGNNHLNMKVLINPKVLQFLLTWWETGFTERTPELQG